MSGDWLRYGTLAYEDRPVMAVLVEALNARCRPGDRVIYRDAFRWRDESGAVISNCYEMFELEQVADFLGMNIVYHFTHAAILAAKPVEQKVREAEEAAAQVAA